MVSSEKLVKKPSRIHAVLSCGLFPTTQRDKAVQNRGSTKREQNCTAGSFIGLGGNNGILRVTSFSPCATKKFTAVLGLFFSSIRIRVPADLKGFPSMASTRSPRCS